LILKNLKLNQKYMKRCGQKQRSFEKVANCLSIVLSSLSCPARDFVDGEARGEPCLLEFICVGVTEIESFAESFVDDLKFVAAIID
jgi:hypothetical protein